MKKIYLKRGKEESLLRKHPWIFSGAVGHVENNPEEGEITEVYSSTGDFLARGHYADGSIMVRILTFENVEIDEVWWERRISDAYAVRKAIGISCDARTDCYRLIHGEGDDLPGLVVDIYGGTAVMQCHSTGMYLARADISAAIRNVMGDRIVAIYDKSSRTLPRIARESAQDGLIWGDEATTENVVFENGHKFVIDWIGGQKTGFFLDQRDNRALVERYAKGRRVLNTFSYTGGFSVYALAGGAKEVVSVDSSAPAIETAERNVALNFGPDADHRAVTMDIFDYMRSDNSVFDMIILDPPAFAKHHKALGNAAQAYKRLNAKAISQIAPGGILFTFSCSQAVSRDLFRTTVFTAAAIAGRRVRILHQLIQPADHPVNIYHPEGEYLKGLVLYVE